MSVEIGSITDGKISGIMPFGAFVSLAGNKTGLVHISEIASTYITDINEVYKVGDSVKVKVIKIDEKGKISLSIKQAAEAKKAQKREKALQKPEKSGPVRPADIDWSIKDDNMSFEDKLSKFKQDSDERMLALKRSNESKRSGGYKRGGSSF